ncbi:MAG TPA: Ig-like domain-containing protein, partial [Rhodocyclaceae bacterium]|nr:Ig-like domain-containing protein [Rhodocyclaceae bacterium]
TTAPTISVVAPSNTNDNTPTITGTTDAAPGSTVTLVVTDSAGAVQTLTAIVQPGGSYSATPGSALADGSYTVTASVTDPAGNTGSGNGNGSIDTTAPTISVVAPDNTNDNTPTISGTTNAAAGSTVTLVVTDSAGAVQTLTATVQPDGGYSATPGSALAGGSYNVVATVSDPAGNTGTDREDGSVHVGVNNPPTANSSIISVAEESTNTSLGLTAPTDADGNPLTITVTGLPSVGSITLADGTPVSNGQVLTAVQLAGLQYDAPADLAAATATSFTYSVSDGTVTTMGTTTINVAPVNDAPITSSTTISVAEESTNTSLGLTAPTDADGNPLTITVTGLPSVGSITLADGTPVSNGQMLTAAQLAGLQYDAPADLAAATTTSFTYSVSDGTVTTAGTTTINVAPVNDAP